MPSPVILCLPETTNDLLETVNFRLAPKEKSLCSDSILGCTIRCTCVFYFVLVYGMSSEVGQGHLRSPNGGSLFRIGDS